MSRDFSTLRVCHTQTIRLTSLHHSLAQCDIGYRSLLDPLPTAELSIHLSTFHIKALTQLTVNLGCSICREIGGPRFAILSMHSKNKQKY